MFFISHKSCDSEQALALYNLLLEIEPNWQGKIFLDCCPDKPLDEEDEWKPRMLRELSNSRYLIFVTSSLEQVTEGSGWLRKEVSMFQDLKENRHDRGRDDYNVSYFGIFLCDGDLERDLFRKPVRGDEYRGLYGGSQHLKLYDGATIEDARKDIVRKIKKMISGESEDQEPQMILDKSIRFAEERVKNNPMAAPEAIEEDLLPTLHRGDWKMGFSKLCELVQTDHVILLGNEGGCGKTTLLTKLYHHYLQLCRQPDNKEPDGEDQEPKLRKMIPLYVDAKNIIGEDVTDLILRYLSKYLFDEHTAMTSKTTRDNAAMLAHEFSRKRETPRYLLIIDGYNELPKKSEEILAEELLQYLPNGRYPNVRVIISGRQVTGKLPENAYVRLEVDQLEETAVSAYLRKHGRKGTIPKSLKDILKIPMYLKLYTDTSGAESLNTKADLLCAFVDRQQEKDKETTATDLKKRKLYHILLQHVLPALSYETITNNSTGSSFVLTKKALEKILYDVQELLLSREYRRYYGEEYREQLRDIDFKNCDEYDLADFCDEYFLRVSKIMHRDSKKVYDFVHQVYRDFFCAWYVAENIRRALEDETCCTALSDMVLDRDVLEFVAELLKEEQVGFDEESGRWNYDCNSRSGLVRMLDLLREEDKGGDAICVANIVAMLKYARRKNLSNLDFSYLDLTGTDMRACHLSSCDAHGQYSTNFAGSVVNRENLFTESHFNEFLAVCTNRDRMACIDTDGILKVWEKKLNPQFPKQIVTDVRYEVRKLLFRPDNKAVYAMTAHEILEIPLPDEEKEFVIRANPRRVFATTRRLRDMKLDEKGRLQFTTNMNSFNFKSIDDPDGPDRYRFYGINSAACVNAAGTRLAFGYITGLECLKLFDIREDGLWQERRFGYGAILNDFLEELENYFRSIKLYYKFPTDNEGYDKRRTYFSYMQQQFMDRTGDYQLVPNTIAKRCIERLEGDKEHPVKLYPNQLSSIAEIVNKYSGIMLRTVKENAPLMYLSGRKITGVEFKKDTNTILVSGTLDREKLPPKRKSAIKLTKRTRYETLVMEVDTDTFEARQIARHVDETPARAYYCGDDVVCVSKNQCYVYDQNDAMAAGVTSKYNLIRNFICLEGSDTFFAISPEFIYEMDRQLRCVRALANGCGTGKLCCFTDEHGHRYLAKAEDKDQLVSKNVIDLMTGKRIKFSYYPNRGIPTKTSATLGSASFKTCADSLVSYENGIKKDEMDIPYKLFVCGCDFTGVTGTVTDPRYLRTLYHMGAKTDPVESPEIIYGTEGEPFKPSQKEFLLPERLGVCPYAYRNGMTLEDDCHYRDAIGGNELYVQKNWALISKGSFAKNALEEADYSILEWVSRLVFALPCMINDLVAAGIIDQPKQYTNAGKRLSGTLHETYKLVFRSQFFIRHVETKQPIFTVEFPYGAQLLEHITNTTLDNPLIQLSSKIQGRRNWTEDGKNRDILINNFGALKEIRRTMALSRWFTITARRYKDQLDEYALNAVFDADIHFNGRARVHGYIRLGEQVFFGQAIRSFGGGELEQEIVNKIERLCILSAYYRSLICYDQQIKPISRQPAVVLIGEDLEHCRLVDKNVRHLYPNVRKLYTFDTLLTSEEAFGAGGNYFEFVDGAPYAVKLEDLL